MPAGAEAPALKPAPAPASPPRLKAGAPLAPPKGPAGGPAPKDPGVEDPNAWGADGFSPMAMPRVLVEGVAPKPSPNGVDPAAPKVLPLPLGLLLPVLLEPLKVNGVPDEPLGAPSAGAKVVAAPAGAVLPNDWLELSPEA